MITICIPTYNYDVTNLVKALISQVNALGTPSEILVMDDVSDELFRIKNHVIQDWKGVRYIELSSKLGRASIRNRLAAESAYEYLIFMDCDSSLPDNQYLARYLPFCAENTVVFGGRTYEQNPPADDRFFRWYYGVNRESKKAHERNIYPYRSFMTNNFLTPKKILQSIPFDESLQLYGHEDTLMGYRFKEAGISLMHIDNPLIHAGLENAADFVLKTEKGLENLLFIARKLNSDKLFINDVRVLKTYYYSRQMALKPIFSMLFQIFRKRLLKILTGKKPSLFIFDLYKLGYLCFTDKK